MKAHFLILFILVSALPIQSQGLIDCVENPFVYERTLTYGGEAANRIKKEALYADFQSTMQSIQEPSLISSFSNWTYNLQGYDKKNFVLDADSQVPISISGKWSKFNQLQIIPRFKVRIFRDDPNVPGSMNGDVSLPVRTPSAMPGIVYLFTNKKLWNKRKPLSTFFGIYAFHHSNGQDGNEFNSENGKINVYNGNFGENAVFEFIIGGKTNAVKDITSFIESSHDTVQYKRKGPGESLKIDFGKQTSFYYKASLEWHPKNLSNQSFSHYNMYGRYRLNLSGGVTLNKFFKEYIVNVDGNEKKTYCYDSYNMSRERFRLTLNLNYILDNKYNRGDLKTLESIKLLNASKRLNTWITGYYVIGESRYDVV